MFTIDEATAAAIRRADEDGGELAGMVELRRYFPLITDNINARRCVRVIAGWRAVADLPGTGDERQTSPADGPAPTGDMSPEHW
jgi:hypothetical protein